MPVFTIIRTDSMYGCFRQCQRCNKKIRSHPGSDGTEPCEDEECVGAESKLAFCLKATVCSIGPSSQRRSVIVLFDKQSQVLMGCQASEFEIMSRNNPQVHEAVDEITYGETFDMELEEPSAHTSHRKVMSIKPHDPDYVPVMARLKQMGYGEGGRDAGDEDGTRMHKRARKGDQVPVAVGTRGNVKKGRYDLCPPDESDCDSEHEPSES